MSKKSQPVVIWKNNGAAQESPLLVSPDTAQIIQAMERGQRSQIAPMPTPKKKG